MRKLLLLSALLMAFAAPTEAKKQRKLTEKDMGAYLFTYFNDPTHSLFMAISYDGYTFTAVNNGEPIISGDSIADQRGIRDPHIYRAPNGKPSALLNSSTEPLPSAGRLPTSAQ